MILEKFSNFDGLTVGSLRKFFQHLHGIGIFRIQVQRNNETSCPAPYSRAPPTYWPAVCHPGLVAAPARFRLQHIPESRVR